MADIRKQLILLACFGVVGSVVRADHPAPVSQRLAQPAVVTPSGITDIALNPSGVLTGRYLDAEGHGIAGAEAVLMQGERAVGKTTTDQTGAYAFANVRTGTYRIAVGRQTQIVRAWETATRPPSARRLLTIIRQEPVMRAQYGTSLTAQVGIAVGVGGAIVAGIALARSDDALEEAAALRRVLKVSSP